MVSETHPTIPDHESFEVESDFLKIGFSGNPARAERGSSPREKLSWVLTLCKRPFWAF